MDELGSISEYLLEGVNNMMMEMINVFLELCV
jgi:hypothetical protein